MLNDSLVTIVQSLPDVMDVCSAAEVTVETNPDTTDSALAEKLVQAGVTRFSLGVQSLDDEVLRTLGRCHTAARAQQALHELVTSGAEVSVDLMCGVPGQTGKSWQDTLERVSESGANHVSVYPLALEEDTPLAHAVAAGRISQIDDDMAAEMMEQADDTLSSSGFARYEVASYARPGAESVHNTGYWTARPYVGVGPSAASMLRAETFAQVVECRGWRDPALTGVGRNVAPIPADAQRVRFVRAADTVGFLSHPTGPPEEVEYLTATEAAAEDAMLGLRLARGISEELAAQAGVKRALEELSAVDLVEHYGDRWRVTHKGWLLGNEVYSAVWSAGAHREVG
jgi:oxygen-independent coproporphyrinogen-3 oxidase